MNTKWICAIALALASVAMAGCGTISKGVADDGGSAEKLVFPDPGDAVLKGGTFPDVADLRSVTPGMTRDQLYQMFGRPHFHEGAWNVREWDYLFNFRTGDDGRYVTCEYKVLFDRDQIAQSFYWKPGTCAELIRPKPVAEVPQPVPLPAEPIQLSTDALFAFDEWHLSGAGRQALDQLLGKITSASQVEDIKVVGYTDRIGTDAYNMNLSRQRAGSVRDYLAGHGVPDNAMFTEGRGKANPLVACDGVPAGQLIACLAPNRRVELSGQVRP